MISSQQIEDGDRPPFWKCFFHYISAGNQPILTEFGTRVRTLILRMITWQKNLKFYKSKIVDGRHLENRFSDCVSAPYCPINAKFGGKKQNRIRSHIRFRCLVPTRLQRAGMARQYNSHMNHRSRDRSSEFRKFKMAEVAIFRKVFHYISAENQPTSIKFGALTRIFIPRMVRLQKLQSLQIQDGGRA